MTIIKLNHLETIELANKMKTAAGSFESNQKVLEQTVKKLKSSWSGSASDVMQEELQAMNKNAIELQNSLKDMAEFVMKAADGLRMTDQTSLKFN